VPVDLPHGADIGGEITALMPPDRS
jgi:hypothetical protein